MAQTRQTRLGTAVGVNVFCLEICWVVLLDSAGCTDTASVDEDGNYNYGSDYSGKSVSMHYLIIRATDYSISTTSVWRAGIRKGHWFTYMFLLLLCYFHNIEGHDARWKMCNNVELLKPAPSWCGSLAVYLQLSSSSTPVCQPSPAILARLCLWHTHWQPVVAAVVTIITT